MIIDGSWTMANHQRNLAANFSSFISGFATKGYDYQMAIASTDAWVLETDYKIGGCGTSPNTSGNPVATYISSADCANTRATWADLTAFRDGDIYGTSNGGSGSRSGHYLLTSQMPVADVVNTFATNAKTGIRGDGTREAAFQSLRAVLRRGEDGSVAYGGDSHTALAQFRRPDAFLAVIIVSDEEDQSKKKDGTSYATKQEYVDSFISFLDGYTSSTPGHRNYNVSSITIDDINNCSYALNGQASQGDRYVAIAQAARGVVGNICATDFSSKLTEIASRIVSLSTRFAISLEPNVDTIQVLVNGQRVPHDDHQGWTLVEESGLYFIEFRGSSTPASGATIAITYDPKNFR